MRNGERYVLFDWAFKHILRQKANFDILEGFLSELLRREVAIVEMLESESNRPRISGKQNRVDILANVRTPEDSESVLAGVEELVFIEMQVEPDPFFFHRVLFGASRLVSEHLDEGEDYGRVKKVISVSIIYFPLGEGDDYIYCGRNLFVGERTGNPMRLSLKGQLDFKAETIADIFPRYYLLNLRSYDDQLDSPIDQWVYFLKHSRPPENFTAKGLRQAEQKLKVMQMPPEERAAYNRFVEERRELLSEINATFNWQMDNVFSSGFRSGEEKGRQEGLEEGMEKGMEAGKKQGLEEGIEKGMEAGKAEAARELARKLLQSGLPNARVAELTGLPEAEIERLAD